MSLVSEKISLLEKKIAEFNQLIEQELYVEASEASKQLHEQVVTLFNDLSGYSDTERQQLSVVGEKVFSTLSENERVIRLKRDEMIKSGSSIVKAQRGLKAYKNT